MSPPAQRAFMVAFAAAALAMCVTFVQLLPRGWNKESGDNSDSKIVGAVNGTLNGTLNSTPLAAKPDHAMAAVGDPLIDRWRVRFGRPGGGYIFFKHIRKAGGSSMRDYLGRLIRHHTRDHHVVVNFYEQEWQAMDNRCPSIDPRWNRTLSVIVLRDPVERQISEFFYSGPGSKGNISLLYKRKEYGETFSTLLRAAMLRWVDEEGMARKRSFGRFFSDNFQTRVLSGETEVQPRNMTLQEGPSENCSPWSLQVLKSSGRGDGDGLGLKTTKRETCAKCNNGCDDGPCVYGGGWGGGVPSENNVTERSQTIAMKVLDSFDIVLLTETMEDNEQSAFLADVAGLPLGNAALAGTKINVKTFTDSAEKRRHLYRDLLQRTAPELLDLLQYHSRFEIGLYRHAVEINRRHIKQWRSEKDAVLDLLGGNRKR